MFLFGVSSLCEDCAQYFSRTDRIEIVLLYKKSAAEISHCLFGRPFLKYVLKPIFDCSLRVNTPFCHPAILKGVDRHMSASRSASTKHETEISMTGKITAALSQAILLGSAGVASAQVGRTSANL